MPKMIFINLPVTDLARSVRFYEATGAVRNPAFSDDKVAYMVVSETIYVMLLTHERFSHFTTRHIVNAAEAAQVLLCLSQDSRAEVDDAVSRAIRAGGTADPTPTQDYGVMYGRSYGDPDGHIWEVMWMDAEAAKAGANPA